MMHLWCLRLKADTQKAQSQMNIDLPLADKFSGDISWVADIYDFNSLGPSDTYGVGDLGQHWFR